MIPVTLQPEPTNFDTEVRKRGQAWLIAQGIAFTAPPPDHSKLPAYWSETNKDLWKAYSGICAYLAIFFEWPLGASSTDHFVAKSQNAGEAYEWNNYRLSCLGANRNKNKFDDVLDPIGMQSNIFELNLLTGEIKPDKSLNDQIMIDAANATIDRLKLNSPELKDMRSQHFTDYIRNDISENYLCKHSPFVHYEAMRQGLL